jgi:hypothetical protein
MERQFYIAIGLVFLGYCSFVVVVRVVQHFI